MCPREDHIALGVLYGPSLTDLDPAAASGSSPSSALESAIESFLDDNPVFVGFSGGCDSSLVLSAATRVCRRHGHGDPIPVTLRYRSAATDEQQYQVAVIEHLGLTTWLTIDADERADLLDHDVTAQLRQLGVTWPPMALTHRHLYRQLGSGVFLSGEGGDEVLGARRVTGPLLAARHVKRHHSLPPAPIRHRLTEALLPNWVRRRYAAPFSKANPWDWVEGGLLERLTREFLSCEGHEPWRPSHWPAYHLGLRRVSSAYQNIRFLAAQHDVRWEAPLLNASFMATLASAVPWNRYVGRRAVLKGYFPGYLPTAVLERDGKATFNEVYFGPNTKEFAAQWDGSGAPEGVDPAALKRQWLSPMPHGCTAMLLHHVWLATNCKGAGPLSR